MEKIEKVNPIILHAPDGQEYTLEFSRESIKFAEARGFSPEDIDRYPATKIPEVFFYAFRMHHKNVSRDKTDKILEAIGVSDEMLKRLGQLYVIPLTVWDKDEEEVKNAGWRVEL